MSKFKVGQLVYYKDSRRDALSRLRLERLISATKKEWVASFDWKTPSQNGEVTVFERDIIK